MAELPQKILKNITDVFENDILLDEYDFLPVLTPEYNTNPVIVENHKLGVEAWAVKVVFLYCYGKLLAVRRQPGNGKNVKLNDQADLAQWSRIIVMVTADCATAWNIRKELIQLGHLEDERELHLTRLVLIRHPKSSDTFYQRKWLLQRKLRSFIKSQKDNQSLERTPQISNDLTSETLQETLQLPHVSSDTCNSNSSRSLPNFHTSAGSPQVAAPGCPESRRLLGQELELCQLAAERYANNYHAWTHRLGVLQHGHDAELLEVELGRTESFMRRHVSDHSAYHYRQALFGHLSHLHPPAQHLATLHGELEACADLIQAFPGHEAMWYHRRSLLCQLRKQLEIPHENLASDHKSLPKKLKSLPVCVTSVAGLLREERTFCDMVIDTCQLHSDSERQWQATLAQRHKTAATRILNMDHDK